MPPSQDLLMFWGYLITMGNLLSPGNLYNNKSLCKVLACWRFLVKKKDWQIRQRPLSFLHHLIPLMKWALSKWEVIIWQYKQPWKSQFNKSEGLFHVIYMLKQEGEHMGFSKSSVSSQRPFRALGSLTRCLGLWKKVFGAKGGPSDIP